MLCEDVPSGDAEDKVDWLSIAETPELRLKRGTFIQLSLIYGMDNIKTVNLVL